MADINGNFTQSQLNAGSVHGCVGNPCVICHPPKIAKHPTCPHCGGGLILPPAAPAAPIWTYEQPYWQQLPQIWCSV